MLMLRFITFPSRFLFQGVYYLIHQTRVQVHQGLDEVHVRGLDKCTTVLPDEVQTRVNQPFKQVIDETKLFFCQALKPITINSLILHRKTCKPNLYALIEAHIKILDYQIRGGSVFGVNQYKDSFGVGKFSFIKLEYPLTSMNHSCLKLLSDS